MSNLRPLLRSFGLAVAATVVVALATPLVYEQLLGINARLWPLLWAVALAAWFGGTRSGLFATVLSAMVGVYLASERANFSPWRSNYQLRLAAFLTVGAITSWLVGSSHAARRRAAERQRELEREVVERRRAEATENENRQLLAAEIRRREDVEMALREREERIRMAVESAEIGTWDFNPITGERRWSNRAKIMFGLPVDTDVTNISFLDRLHPDDRERANLAVQKALDPSGDGVYDIDCRLVTAEGAVRWFIAKGQALFEGEPPHRRPIRFIGTVMEITERKQAEIALSQAEQRFRIVATQAPVGIFQTDSAGRCLFVNQVWCEIAGAAPDEALGDGWQRFVHPEDRQRVVAEWQEATQQRRNQSTEFRFLNRTTGARWVMASAAPILDATGVVNGYVGTIVDVTERKAAEDIVRASEARLQGFLDNSTAVIYLKDLDSRYLLVNRQWETRFGKHSDQVVGCTPDQMYPAETARALRNNDLSVIRGAKSIVVEEDVDQPDGMHTYITVKFPIKDAQGKVAAVGGISTDITDRKKALEALEAEQELLRHTIELQDRERQLITYEIHDGLVQYATGALMRLEALRDQAPEPDVAQQVEDVVGLLKKTVAEGRRLINGIRTPVLDDWGIIAAVEQLVDEEERAHVDVEFVKDSSIGRMTPDLEEALYRITQEAMTNVHKHSQSTKVRIELRRRDQRVHLSVRDWGVGFMPSNSAKKKVHGLLGMTERARIAGGRCTIESTPGQGTEVRVDLPYLARNGASGYR
jgi:PAS domain S-box-containing protein